MVDSECPSRACLGCKQHILLSLVLSLMWTKACTGRGGQHGRSRCCHSVVVHVTVLESLRVCKHRMGSCGDGERGRSKVLNSCHLEFVQNH